MNHPENPAPAPPLKCLYCHQTIENPNPEEEVTSICDPCSEKDHQENP